MVSRGALQSFKDDGPAAVVVFLVALPLCLGIALAAGAPLFSGLIAGVVGGIIVGALSGSALGVSGPAAGLAVVILQAIHALGSFEFFLAAVVLSGGFQILFGLLKTGVIAQLFPTSVIEGMLAAIGILIAIKQIPHAFGSIGGETLIGFIPMDLHWGAFLISIACLIVLLSWDLFLSSRYRFFTLFRAPMAAVIAGVVLQIIFEGSDSLGLASHQKVSVPVLDSMGAFFSEVRFPAPEAFFTPAVYLTGLFLAVVGSVETLLCADATDKQDPLKRKTPLNRELIAQGAGNIFCGLIGGLPITQVVVRSSVNIQAGGKTKLSTILHGFIILLSLLTIPHLLNKIPLATLAAILILVGYKLAHPKVFKGMWDQGISQFVPFIATLVGILLTDLLVGIMAGLAVATAFYLLSTDKFAPDRAA